MGETREKILDAAEKLILSKGLAHVTTKEIAREVGRSESALYRHFDHKEEIFFALMTEHLPAFHDTFQTHQVGIATVRENLVAFVLSIAARSATIISPTPTFTWAQEGAPADVPLEEKIAWIREAAGERFALLELAQPAFALSITDSPVPVSPPRPQAGGPLIPERLMSLEQTVEHVLELRERYGFSYIQVQGGQMENFAPVVARLAGN